MTQDVQLTREILEKLASAGFHGGSAGAKSFFEKLPGFGAKNRVDLRKIGERLESKCANDGAAVVEVMAKGCDGTLAFPRVEWEARDHLCEVPAQFDLSGFGKEAEEFRFVSGEEARISGGDFFHGV